MTTPLHFTLELDHPHEEPIEGRLTHGADEPRHFVGYTELIAVLEDLRTHPVALPIQPATGVER